MDSTPGTATEKKTQIWVRVWTRSDFTEKQLDLQTSLGSSSQTMMRPGSVMADGTNKRRQKLLELSLHLSIQEEGRNPGVSLGGRFVHLEPLQKHDG